ncbi:cytochrome C oxidase subunit IV family protein [Burkholderia sp. Ac-20353]|uniref:cytochrome C oxidase subunit IV family protein n=1 Tax=Burkholderia sp. Ac-20353 TaxID=2703894 RepID=UPI00197C247D|nr:cytochrome C oxidase subunit IV family protein [Burkholderia sp. Ac-20353]MBN3788532.1 cytochrome C oxidase subunit IV family protein [Burkholderia sp. Ac-20353]
MDKTERRLVIWWAVLVLATLASWETGHAGAMFSTAPSIIIVGLAFAKAAAVMMQYMDARTAPWPLKIGLGAWIVGVGIAVAVLWLSGSQEPFEK